MHNTVTRLLSVLVAIPVFGSIAYGKTASKEPKIILTQRDNILLQDKKKQSTVNQIDQMLKKKQAMLQKTQRSHVLVYTSLYDDIIELTILKNKQRIAMGQTDAIEHDKICDLAIKYGEVEFIKTEYYKTPFHDSVARTLQNTAILYEQYLPPMAEKYLRAFLKIKEHLYLAESEEVAKAYDLLGDHYRFAMANFKKAIVAYTKAKSIREKIYGINDSRTTENFGRLAFSLYYHGDKSGRAETLLQHSIERRKKSPANRIFLLYQAYMDMGHYYFTKGDTNKYLEYFRKAKKTFVGDNKSDYEMILKRLSDSSR